jgi:hypothetical protein
MRNVRVVTGQWERHLKIKYCLSVNDEIQGKNKIIMNIL